MSDGLGWYLNTIGRVPLLTPAEEIELGTAIRSWLDHPDGPDAAPPGVQRRGRRAKDRFVAANLRLSVSYVKNRCQRLIRAGEVDDVIQAANLGLVRAVEKFDPTRGYKFSTYAYWWIRQAVNRHADHHVRLIRMPGLHGQHLAKLTRVTREHEQQHGRSPTHEELAIATGLSVDRIRQLLSEHRRIVSLDLAVGDDGDEVLGDLLAAPSDPEDDGSPDLQRLRQQISQLPPQQQELISLRWGFAGPVMDLRTAAAAIGCTYGEALQMERDALEQLRQAQQQPRPEQSQPERFADRIDGQIPLDLPGPAVVVVVRRRQTGPRRCKNELHFEGGDTPECAIDQLALDVPVMDQVRD